MKVKIFENTDKYLTNKEINKIRKYFFIELRDIVVDNSKQNEVKLVSKQIGKIDNDYFLILKFIKFKRYSIDKVFYKIYHFDSEGNYLDKFEKPDIKFVNNIKIISVC